MKEKQPSVSVAQTIERLQEGAFEPSPHAVARSRSRLRDWFESAAPTIHWVRQPSPLGTLHLAAGQGGLVAISFTEDTQGFLRSLDPKARIVEGGEAVEQCRRQLQDYLAGRRLSFTLATDLSNVTQFQRRVLKAIAKIPAGEVRSYGEIARAVGKPRAARAVGQALANNPIPIVLPCHRVLASDGGLGGYAGGLERKRLLLELEGVELGP